MSQYNHSMDQIEWIDLWTCSKEVQAEQPNAHRHVTLQPGMNLVEIEIPLPSTRSALEKVHDRLVRRLRKLRSFPEFRDDENLRCLSFDVDGYMDVKVPSVDGGGRMNITQGYRIVHDDETLEARGAPMQVELYDESQKRSEIITDDVHINYTPHSANEAFRVFLILRIESSCACDIDVGIVVEGYTFEAYDWDHIYGNYSDDYRHYASGMFDEAFDDLSM